MFRTLLILLVITTSAVASTTNPRDRASTPSQTENAVYNFEDKINNKEWPLSAHRNGDTTTYMQGTRPVETITEDEQVRNTRISQTGKRLILEFVYTKPLFRLQDEEKTEGELRLIDRLTNKVEITFNLDVQAKIHNDGTTVYHVTYYNKQYVCHMLIAYRRGSRLPLERGFHFINKETEKIESSIIYVKQ